MLWCCSATCLGSILPKKIAITIAKAIHCILGTHASQQKWGDASDTIDAHYVKTSDINIYENNGHNVIR